MTCRKVNMMMMMNSGAFTEDVKKLAWSFISVLLFCPVYMFVINLISPNENGIAIIE